LGLLHLHDHVAGCEDSGRVGEDVGPRGGIPIVVGGQVLGAIGVSGETPAIDEGIAIAGAQAAKSFKKKP
jgi:uncharacterized protein GlcG (DUF336 family)